MFSKERGILPAPRDDPTIIPHGQKSLGVFFWIQHDRTEIWVPSGKLT